MMLLPTLDIALRGATVALLLVLASSLFRGFGTVLAGRLAAAFALRDQVARAVDAALKDGVDDTHELTQRIRRTAGKWVSSTHRRRPMIIPVVVEA